MKRKQYNWEQLCSKEWVDSNLSKEEFLHQRNKLLREFRNFIPLGLYMPTDASYGFFFRFTNKWGQSFACSCEGLQQLKGYEEDKEASYTADEQTAIRFIKALQIGDTFSFGNGEFSVVAKTPKTITIALDGEKTKMNFNCFLTKQRNFIRNLIAQLNFESSQRNNPFHEDFRVSKIYNR